jgi:putative polyketide hydroxylase
MNERGIVNSVPTPDERVPVLIVGGGLTGLSAALLLASRGIRPLLVERHPALLIHPRARGFNPRTLEIYRQLGLEPDIEAAAFARGETFVWSPVLADTLADAAYRPVEEPGDDEILTEVSPSPFSPIDQDQLEIIIARHAVERSADIRFATELTDFSQDDDGVTATIVDLPTGVERTVQADYLIAADGHRGGIRQRLGIDVDGPGPFFDILTLLFEADLSPALRGRSVTIAYLQQPTPGTALLALDEAGRRWGFGTAASPEMGEKFDDDVGVAMIRAAAGLPDVDVVIKPQIPGTDRKALFWSIGAQVARRFRDGRVFLAGDAAHIVPPTGGFGANTGIQDAHNLAWKLAAVLRGEAGPTLLDTYDEERRSVALMTMGQSMARAQARMGIGDPGAAAPLLPFGEIAYGYVYRSGAIVDRLPGDAATIPAADLHAQPGTRAPHVWLDRNGERVSTIDLFGRNFILLTGADGAAWRDAAKAASARLGVPLDVWRIGAGGDLADPAGDWAAVFAAAPSGFILVRPDGVVAWRADAPPADPGAALADALATATGRAAVAANRG